MKVAAEHRIVSESVRSRHDIDTDTSDIAAAFGAVLAQVAARTEPPESTASPNDTVAADEVGTGAAASETDASGATDAEAPTTEAAASQPAAGDEGGVQAPGAEITAEGDLAGVIGEVATPEDPGVVAIDATVESDVAIATAATGPDNEGGVGAVVSTDAADPAVPAAADTPAVIAEVQATTADASADASADAAQPSPAPPASAAPQPTRATTPAPVATGGDAPAPTAQPDIPSPTAQLVNVLAPLRARANGSTHLTLSLRPDDLGQVDVEFRIERGTVHLALRAEQAGTATLLRESLGDLRGRLQEHGITTGDMSVGEHAHREGSHRDESPEVDHRSDDEAAVAAIDPLTTDADALVDVRM